MLLESFFRIKIMPNTDKRIVYNNPEFGTVSIVIPAPKCKRTLEEIQARDVPSGISTSYIIDKSEIPTDYSFRDAWTYTP